jgi:hypothetical protein
MGILRCIPWHECSLVKQKPLLTQRITTVFPMKVLYLYQGSSQVSHQGLSLRKAMVFMSVPQNYALEHSLRNLTVSLFVPRNYSPNFPGRRGSIFHLCRGQEILLPRSQQLWCPCCKRSLPTHINLIADKAAPVEHIRPIY